MTRREAIVALVVLPAAVRETPPNRVWRMPPVVPGGGTVPLAQMDFSLDKVLPK